ncbi:MAG: hypothetical protein O4807_18135 [Trichodesmium sp. St19_bin2]|nr:hypothetical protein [Trichodesmium sp. St19_bin2]
MLSAILVRLSDNLYLRTLKFIAPCFGQVSVKALAVDQSPITKPEWNVTKNKTIRHKLVENTSMSCSKTVLVYGNRNNHLPTISGDNVKKIYDSIKIASGCKGLGAELSISYPLSIEYEGENYRSAYEIDLSKIEIKVKL